MLANWLAVCGRPVDETLVATLESEMRLLADAARV
jgi:hypothetical protein